MHVVLQKTANLNNPNVTLEIIQSEATLFHLYPFSATYIIRLLTTAMKYAEVCFLITFRQKLYTVAIQNVFKCY